MTLNLEAGVKLDLYGGKTSATAAVFELERTNIKNVGPGGVLIPVGEQRHYSIVAQAHNRQFNWIPEQGRRVSVTYAATW